MLKTVFVLLILVVFGYVSFFSSFEEEYSSEQNLFIWRYVFILIQLLMFTSHHGVCALFY